MAEFDLSRFVAAQAPVYAQALAELRRGRKESHWMWFVFPQLRGLGHSPAAQFYAISSVDEARHYVKHALLGPRLAQSVQAVLAWSGKRSAEQILGPVDALKLRSSMTLFDLVEPGALFGEALKGFYAGERDQRTLALLNDER